MRDLRAFHALALLGIVASSALIVGLLVMTAQMDRQQRQREITLVSAQIDSTLAQARQSGATLGHSDEAIKRLDHARDEEWAHATFANRASSYVMIYTFDHDDKMISGPSLPSNYPPSAPAFEKALPERVARIRQLSSSPSTSGRIDLVAGVTETFRVGDEFFLMLVAAFNPDSSDLRLINRRPPLLVAVTPWSEFIKISLAGDGIIEASIVDAALATGDTSKALTDAVGGPAAAIVWKPSHPGADLMTVILAPLLALVFLFLALVAYAYRHGVVSARELMNSKALAQHIAGHDELTGLANRRLFMEELATAFAIGRQGRAKPALVLIDLDRFKAVNDTFGHQCGDELIREAGRRLASACGPRDLCARLGGDEFIILAPDCDAADAVGLATHALQALAGTVQLSLASIRVAGSAGISLFSGQASEAELMRDADIALYHTKECCRGSLCLFEPAMASKSSYSPLCDPPLLKAAASADRPYAPPSPVGGETSDLLAEDAACSARAFIDGEVPLFAA